MIPTLSELLVGNLVTLSDPPPPESAGEFMAAKVAVVGLISFLCAQEAEKGAAVRVDENCALRVLFADAVREGWAPDEGAELLELSKRRDESLLLSNLDHDNAKLRLALIDLQTAVEADPSQQGRLRERRILVLLLKSAEDRALTLPGQPGAA